VNNHPPLTAETREQISSSEYEVLRALWNSLLFFSVLSTPLPPDLTAPARQPDSPRQPLQLFSLLKRYAVDLFNCEDKHYPQTGDLSSWRDTLARRTEELVLENILKFEKGRQSLRFHAGVDEMMASVREGLAVHISNLSKECAPDRSKAPQEAIGQAASESAPSERTGGTSLITEDAAATGRSTEPDRFKFSRCRSHVENALWKMEIFGANRERAPETEKEREVLLSKLTRVVVAIDPSGCAGENDKRSDEVGIVVAGVGHDGIARILEDATGRYSPNDWANRALALYDRWKADRIVAETNYGGAMVESTIHTVRSTAPVKLVTASRGKVQRAEPVAAIYSQGKVRHVGHFADLERQYCHFSTAGYMGARSPDHADAAIWALTELMIDREPQPNIRFPDISRHTWRPTSSY